MSKYLLRPAGTFAPLQFGTAADRPTATAGIAIYFATDTGEVTFSDGTNWNVIKSTSANILTIASSNGALEIWGTTSSDIISYGADGQHLTMTDAIGTDVVGSFSLQSRGGIDVTGPGSGYSVTEGTNCKQGIATLVSSEVVVANTSVTATSRIFLTIQSPGGSGSVGTPYVGALTPGTSFTIKSTGSSDTSVVAYEIFERG